MGTKDKVNLYLREVVDKPFEWGTHDCLTFTNGAWKVMYGYGWADDWLGRYMIDGRPMRKDEMRKAFKFSTFEQGLRSKLTPSERPVFGSLVTTRKAQRWIIGSAMGISLGSRCVFLSKDGLIKLNIEDVESSWVPNVKQI